MSKHLLATMTFTMVLALMLIASTSVEKLGIRFHENTIWLQLGMQLATSRQTDSSVLGQTSISLSTSESYTPRLRAVVAFFSHNCALTNTLADVMAANRPPDLLVDYYWGKLHYDCGEETEALSLWRESGVSVYYSSRCRETAMQGEHPAEAMALCEVAVQLAPNSATDFDYLGVTQVQLGLYENAALSFERALALDSSINGLLLRVAGAYQELARPEVSQLYLERAAEMFPQDARVYIALGKLSESQGDFAAGQSYLARAIQLDPAEAEGYYLLGRIAFNQGDLSRAQFYLEHATELDAVRPEYFLLLGDLHCTAHNIGEAQESYMQAQTLLPDNAGISEKMRQAETRCR